MVEKSGNGELLGSKNYIEKVAVVGASGHCGKFMVEALLQTGKHVVTAITRTDSKASQLFPPAVQVKTVDYDIPSSLVDALRGQDALVITLAVVAQKDQQEKLIRAAAEAQLPWILPNEWGIDSANDSLATDVFIIGDKRAAYKLMADLGKSSWISLSTGFWYEWSLAMHENFGFGFDFARREVTLFNDGETYVNTSTWPQVGRAVASLLSLKVHADGGEGDSSPCLDKFRNQYLYTSSFTITQKDMLQSVLRVTGTKLEDWVVHKQSAQDRYAEGWKQMQAGDRAGFGKMLYSRDFYPDGSGNVEKTKKLSNDLLGLPKEDLDQYTKIAIERAKEMNK